MEDTGDITDDGITSDPTVTGRILNEGSLGGVTIEVDTNGDGTADLVTETDDRGEFAFRLAEVTEGAVTYQVRAQEIDPVTGNVLTGTWTSFSFTYEIPVNAPAEVSQLNLVEDTGEVTDDGITYNAALTGQITNDGDLGGLTVQFDHNGDGLVDGISVTDENGQFTYAPTGLSEGAETIAARVEEPGDGLSLLHGSWVSITFALEQPPRTDLRIASLDLTNDTGLSATDKVTDDPQVAGTIASEDSLEGITIQFDHNSDGVVDGTATADASGQFTYTPANLTEGVVPLRARTFVDNGNGTQTVSLWYMLAFVYSSDPDGTTAQTQRSDLINYETQVQDARNIYDQALQTTEQVFQTAWQNAEATYQTNLENAQTTRDNTLASARSLWDTQFAAAKSAYRTAINNAKTVFQTELASFSGDTTSFELPEFVWPDPPSLAADPWTGQSLFHVEGPRYDGREYDFEGDSAYQDALATLENIYNQAVKAAEAAFKTATKAADAARDQEVAAARAEYQAAEQAAREARDAPLPPHPSIDVAAVHRDHAARTEQAQIDYDAAVVQAETIRDQTYVSIMNTYDQLYADASSNYQPAIDAADSIYNAALDAANDAYAAEMANAPDINVDPEGHADHQAMALAHFAAAMAEPTAQWEAAYKAAFMERQAAWCDVEINRGRENAEADQLFADRISEAIRIRDVKFSESQRLVDRAAAEVSHWKDEQRTHRQHAYELAIATAAEIRDNRIALANKLRVDAYADAQRTRTLAYNDAEADRAYGIIAAQQSALASWDGFEDDFWSSYQVSLANHRLSYMQSVSGETTALVAAEADAAHTQALQLADAVYLEALDANSIQHIRAGRTADSTRDHQLEVHAALLVRQHTDADKYRDRRNAEAFDVEEYEVHNHAISFFHTVARNQVRHALHVAIAEADYDYSIDQDSEAYSLAYDEAHDIHDEQMALINHTHANAVINNRETLSQNRGQADYNLTVNLHGSEQTERNRVADAGYVREEAFAAARRDATLDLMNAALQRNNDFAAAVKQFADSVAPAYEAFEDDVAGHGRTLGINAASAQSTFRNQVASDYVTRVNDFNTETPTPWGEMQADLASVEQTYMAGLGTANNTFQSSFEQAVFDEIDSQTDAQTILAGALASANFTADTTTAADRATFLTTLANKQYDYDVAAAEARRTHTKDVVAENKSYHDKLALGRLVLHNAINGALWARQRTTADLDLNLELDVIDSTQHATLSDAAMHQERVDVAGAHTTRATTAAQDRLTWTQNVGNIHVAYAQAMANASNTLATAVKGARIQLAQDVAAAANGWETSVSGADETFSNSLQSAGGMFRTDLTSAGNSLNSDLTAAGNLRRENTVLASADFEVDLMTDHAAALASAANHLLGTFRAGAAASERDFLTSWRTHQSTLQTDLSGSETTLASSSNTAASGLVAGTVAADSAFVSSTESAGKTYRISLTSHRGTYNIALETAAATQAESEAFARGDYAVALADAHRLYDNAVAAANVTYVASVMPARATRYIEQDSPASVAAYDAAVAAAEQQRKIDIKAANVTRVTNIGDALIARETAYGNAEVAYATAAGNAYITYLTSSHGAEDTYDTSWHAADNLHISSTNSAIDGFDLSMTQAGSSFIDTTGTARTNYQQNMITPLGTHATGLATANMVYHTDRTEEIQSNYTTLLQTDSTDYTQQGAWRINAKVDWMNAVGPAYVSFQNSQSQAGAEWGRDAVAADADLGRDIASAGETHLTGSQGNANTFINGEAGLATTYDISTTNSFQGWEIDLAGADRDLDIDRAQAQKARRIAYATAEKNYQIAVAEAESIDGSDNSAALAQAETNKTIAIADAELAYKTDLADADKIWTEAVALADKTETYAWAAANHAYDTGLASLDSSYLTNQTATDGVYGNGLASAEAGHVNDLSTANTTLYAAQNTADASYITADHGGRVLSLNNLHTAAQLPFTEFAAGQAAAEQTAWANVQTNFNTTVTSINGETTAYDNFVGTQITSLASNAAGAQQTYIGTVAPAIQIRDTKYADAWKLYDEQSATAEEIYQKQIAQAKRDHAVAMAQAERNLAVNGDQTAYDNAVALADSQFNEAKLNAARMYAIAEIGAKGTRKSSFQSADTTLDSTEGPAHVARTLNVTTAIRDALIDDAEAYRDLYLNVLEDLDNFEIAYANSRVTELTSFDTTNDTPWSGLAVGRATAGRDLLTTLQPHNLSYRTSTADAEVAFTTSDANAWHARVNTQTSAQVDLQGDLNTAKINNLNAEQSSIQSGVNLGITPVSGNETYPTGDASPTEFSSDSPIATASPDSSTPSAGEQTNTLSVEPPFTIDPYSSATTESQLVEGDFQEASNIQDIWNTTDPDTFYNWIVDPEGTLRVLPLDLHGDNPLGEATDTSVGVLELADASRELKILDPKAKKSEPNNKSSFYLPKIDNFNMGHWGYARRKESQWAGFLNLTKEQQDKITKKHLDILWWLNQIDNMIKQDAKERERRRSLPKPPTAEPAEKQPGEGTIGYFFNQIRFALKTSGPAESVSRFNDFMNFLRTSKTPFSLTLSQFRESLEAQLKELEKEPMRIRDNFNLFPKSFKTALPVWRGAYLYARKHGLPTTLIEWAMETNLSVHEGDYPSYHPFFNRMYIDPLPLGQLEKIGKANKFPTLLVNVSVLYNELFHAWFDQFVKGSSAGQWIVRIMQQQVQYDSKRMEKAEEAISELMNHIAHALQNGDKIPTYEEALKSDQWKYYLTPGHESEGESFHGHTDLVAMSEELYYAAIWLMYNGIKKPPGQNAADQLYWMKKHFMDRFRPLVNGAERRNFLYSHR